MRFARYLLLALVSAAAVPASAAGQAQASPTPVIRVSATGEVRARPDEAWVDLGVETSAPTARAAAEANGAAMQRVIEALVRSGVPRDEIETQGFNVFPDYEGRPDGGEPRLRGYRVVNVVSAHLGQVDRVGGVIDAGLAAGANRVNGVRFGVREAERHRTAAVQDAVQRARAEAEAIAAALGVRLGPVLEASTTFTPPQPYPVMMRQMADFAEAGAATPINPGQQTLTATVTVVYRIIG